MKRDLLHDIRYALRSMMRARGVTVVAAATLALGIGANTAMFSLIDAVLIRPLPYRHPDRLVMVWQDLRARGGPVDEWLTPGNYADIRQDTALFDAVAVMTGWRATLTGSGTAQPVVGEQVSHEYFSVLGERVARGRDFSEADDVPNAARVVILSDAFWKRAFGGDPDIVGKTITLNAEPHEVIGVLPAGFRPVIAGDADLWRPLRLNTARPARGLVVLRSVARLRDGVALDRAQTMASTLARQLLNAHPEAYQKVGFTLTPLKARVVGNVRPGLLALGGAVVFVLLIGCANIANLLLARGASRSRELAIRAALGAGRSRVVRQLLTESVILALVGGAIGLILGTWALEAIVALAPAGTPRVSEIHLNGAVLAFTGALTIATGLLFGLAPALSASRRDVADALKSGGRDDAAPSTARLHRVLVAAEIALALMLLAGGGLLLRTLVKLQSADLGFNPDHVLVAFVNPPRTGYETEPKLRAYYDQVLRRAAALPGVRTAALSSVIPLTGGDNDASFHIEGRPDPASPSDRPDMWYRLVSAGYFDAMGMTLTSGRSFAADEAAPSVVINDAMARTFFPGENPLGHRIRPGSSGPWFTIIGTVADARTRGAREAPRAQSYIPYWQAAEPGTYVVLKTDGDPEGLAAPLKAALSAIDPSIPVQNVETLASIAHDSIAQPRFVASIAVAFALLALALAAVGIYGVMAYAVSQRTREIGVRMALGAGRARVFGLVVGNALALAAAGVVAGAAGSLIVARWLASQLYGVAPVDPATLLGVSAILVFVAGAASAVPARRATGIDPIEALRQL